MDNYNSFDLIKKLSFVRTAGSKKELDAANIIKDECKKLGVEAYLEEFPVDNAVINKAQLSFSDEDLSFECVGVGMSSSTPLEGVEGEFTYVSSEMDAEIQDLKGKICLVHSKLVRYKLYKILVAKKAAGLILCTGDVYLDNDEVDLDPYYYRDRHYKFGKIPAVCIRMKDAEKLLERVPKRAHLVVIQEEKQAMSHNVIAEIPGTTLADEVICFSAHYDSVSFSKGSYDNATGAATIMDLLNYFNTHRTKRTMRFVWCGAEEMGLLGSKAYTEKHKDEISSYRLNINVDMTGVTLGSDIAVCTATQPLVNYIKFLAYEKEFACSPKMGVYSSDSTSFADVGIPAVSFARISPTGGARIHSHNDVMDHLSEPNYYRTIAFIREFIERTANFSCFPFEREIPDRMKEELDYYLGRKEKKE